MQKVGQQNAETVTKVFGTISNQMQTIATEMGDYSKKSFEEASKVFEQLLGSKSVEKAIENSAGLLQERLRRPCAQSLRSVRSMPTSPRKPTSR